VARTLKISDRETLDIISDGADALVVIASFLPHGTKPPAHLHPSQVEEFEVLDGVLTVESGKVTVHHAVGARFTIEAGVTHRMWNAADEICTVRWTTTPPLSSRSWFEGLATIQSRAQSGRGLNRAASFGRLTRDHRQTFRPVVAGSPLLGETIMIILATVARRRQSTGQEG